MIDRIYFAALVLNATGLFRFAAVHTGLTIGQVSLGLLVLNLAYLLARIGYSAPLLFRGGVGAWFTLIAVWPLLTLLYAPVLDARNIGLQLYYFTLFYGMIVFTVSNRLDRVERLLGVIVAISIGGMILSLAMPSYFKDVAVLADTTTNAMDRAYGFYLQPNSFAINIVLLFVAWFALWKRKDSAAEVPAILGFLAMILLSGSRTGMVLAIVVVGMMYSYTGPRRLHNARYAIRTAALFACLIGAFLLAQFYISVAQDSVYHRPGDLLDRMSTMLNLKLTNQSNLGEDSSLKIRLAAQLHYIEYISEKPLYGHGFGSAAHYLQTGYLNLSAHSALLTSAFEYGLVYPVAFCLLLLQLYRKRSRREVERYTGTNSVRQFVVICLLLFVLSSLLQERTLYLVLGFFSALVYRSEDVFLYDDSHRHIIGRKRRVGSKGPIAAPPEKGIPAAGPLPMGCRSGYSETM